MKKQYLAPWSEKVNLDPLMQTYVTAEISFGGEADHGAGGDAPGRELNFF
ncbi:MAG: hypothetical protein MJZ64_01455 [Paludibacteraceae bacterium]|nr:hypothetical protein [Paludibacteraceae bacterium]